VKLIVVTQQVDPDHPALGATVAMLQALAARVDELVVLADAAAAGVLPGNCRVRLFGAPTRPARGLAFARALSGELRGADAVLAHMCPIYAVLAAPLARPRGLAVLLWYTQWRPSRLLRVAERASNRVLSVERASFPLASRKLCAIGHGIDPAGIECASHREGGTLELLALGRYSAVKGYPLLLAGVRAALDRSLDVRLAIHGPLSNAAEERHRAELERLVAELALGEQVELGRALPRAQALAALGRADGLASATVSGAADKVVLEAALACVPTVVPEHAFAELVPEELRFRAGDPESLADAIERLVATDAAERGRLGRILRERSLAAHTVDSWADAVVRIASA
jgi:glycosyltransferase involved in cell wall biosynthesis